VYKSSREAGNTSFDTADNSMAFAIGRDQVSIERDSVPATVPDNDTARLMYYLGCVVSVIDCDADEDIRRFTRYSNWASLSSDERDLLVILCYRFSPDVFEGKVFFQSDALAGNSGNAFYKISQVRHRLVAAESVVIAGRSRRVNKIMAYKMIWIRTYYLEPMQRLAQRMSDDARRTKKSRHCVIN
jgi:hypothetical protein